MIDSITVSKDIHLLILETCEHSGLHGKETLKMSLKLTASDGEVYPGLPK